MFHSQSGRPRDEVARSFMSKISEGVAELKFWNFNVPYKAYMALINVKTLQLWKFCNTLDLAHCNIFLNFVCINTLSRNH